jgi:nitrate reductase beta subunit
MSEPGAVAGTITQTNNQGIASYVHYPALNVSATGTDTVPFDAPSGGVGFSGDTVVDSKAAEGTTGENDTVDGQEFEREGVKMGQVLFSMDNLPESPYYKYHTRELTSGNGQKNQTYHSSRSLGRGMNMDNIRNGVYWDNAEADLFTMGLGYKDPNISKSEVEDNEVEDVRDV